MSRGVGELEYVSGLPEVVVVAAAVLTQLGDIWFLFGLVGLLYWLGRTLPVPFALDRRRAAFVLALGIGANALTTTLKEWFTLPRPPGAGTVPPTEVVPTVVESLYVGAATATGYGFPSGHAIGAAVVYGGLALQVGTRRAYASAATVVGVVALTRVVLGVHYLVDVVTGVAVAAVYVAVVYRAGDRGDDVGRALTVAVLIGLLGPVLGEFNFETTSALGGALGARLAWGVVGDAVPRTPTTRRGGAGAVAVGAVFALLFGVVYTLKPAPHLAFLAMALVLAGVVWAPLAGEGLVRRTRVARR